MSDHSKMLAFIAKCTNAEELRSIIKHAKDGSVAVVADAAFRRLISLVPAEHPGTVEHDFWQTVHAFEFVLSEERQKTTRLARTRQKVGRVGVVETLKDWALSAQGTDGFKMLLDRGMPELTGEAIVMRHPEKFDLKVQAAAREKLVRAGVDVSRLPQ